MIISRVHLFFNRLCIICLLMALSACQNTRYSHLRKVEVNHDNLVTSKFIKKQSPDSLSFMQAIFYKPDKNKQLAMRAKTGINYDLTRKVVAPEKLMPVSSTVIKKLRHLQAKTASNFSSSSKPKNFWEIEVIILFVAIIGLLYLLSVLLSVNLGCLGWGIIIFVFALCWAIIL